MDDCGDPETQKNLDKAMPWVGLYIAAASAFCILAMAADAFNGFRRKKLWFPCKYFSLNATSLTLLAVAMKLPMDLNTYMLDSLIDWFAKHIGVIFMSTAIGNFMSSFGSMKNKEIVTNIVALGILVITIAANVCIHLIELQMDSIFVIVYMIPTSLMLLLLATLVSLAITVPTTKRSLESKYQEQHKVAMRDEEELNTRTREAFRIYNQREEMMKYWVMAETSSPQFVMARSVISTTSAVICLLSAIILATVLILAKPSRTGEPCKSPYGVYTSWILYIQSVGVAVGTIAPILRWFVAVSFWCSTTNWNSFKKGFKIEAHWTQTLVEWRDSFSALQIQQNNSRKYLHDVKWFILTFCIGVQILIVLVSKLLFLLSALLLSPFFMCFTHIKKFVKHVRHEAGAGAYLKLTHYVLLLEGESELPRSVLKNICREADNLIHTGRKKQPKCLENFLDEYAKFNKAGQFDSMQIRSLHSEEPPNCWTLPVVTLTSVAIALPNIGRRLLRSVSEGLLLAKIVEKTLVKNTELVNIRKAADIYWVGVVLYMKWLDIDLRSTFLKCKNSKAVLQELSKKAKETVMEFKRKVEDSVVENPVNWPAKVVAANSMYRISETILLSCDEEENEQKDKQLFTRLSVMIADILAACLTNLPHVITTMCHRNAIEKREKSVRKAFLLLAKTEQIAELLQRRKWPSLDHDKAACIEEWRALFWQDKDDPEVSNSTSSDVVVTTTQPCIEEN